MFRTSPPDEGKRRSNRSGRGQFSTGANRLLSVKDESFPLDLIRFSIKAEQKKRRQHYTPQAHYYLGHAAPLISINHRDVKILDELFLREDIGDIVGDVEAMLKQVLPAPCWEDDPFEAVIQELL